MPPTARPPDSTRPKRRAHGVALRLPNQVSASIAVAVRHETARLAREGAELGGHDVSSWRSRLRSNLPFGERGSADRTTTVFGIM